MNSQERYCPRCDLNSDGQTRVTVWTNEQDHGLELACSECGLREASPLTVEEHRAALRRYERPTRARRNWRYV